MSKNDTNAIKCCYFSVFDRDRAWAESMKMGSFLSVCNGSDEPPKFLELHYEGLPDVKECVALVGKGITFDRFVKKCVIYYY